MSLLFPFRRALAGDAELKRKRRTNPTGDQNGMHMDIQRQCQIGVELHAQQQISKSLIGRRLHYGKDHSGIEQAALAARLLKDDLSADAVGVAAALLTFGSTSLVAGKERELLDHTIMARLHEDVRFGAGLRALVGKGIVSANDSPPRARRYKFLPQELGETISICLPKGATWFLAMETYYGHLHALVLCLIAEQICKASPKESEEVAFPIEWLLRGIKYLDIDGVHHDVARAVIDDLVEVGAISVRHWTREQLPIVAAPGSPAGGELVV